MANGNVFRLVRRLRSRRRQTYLPPGRMRLRTGCQRLFAGSLGAGRCKREPATRPAAEPARSGIYPEEGSQQGAPQPEQEKIYGQHESEEQAAAENRHPAERMKARL